MNILVTGANGQLGNEMRIVSRGSQDQYIFTDVNELDITDVSAVEKFVSSNDIKLLSIVRHILMLRRQRMTITWLS